MPPRQIPRELSPPPTAQSPTVANDILIIQDLADTLDQIPSELTRVHSDLNELGAVLYSTLLSLESKLNTLIEWIQDDSVGPDQRFQLLQEIAEESAKYKLGGDDKIRVSGGACDGLMAHQKHISNLLAASTLLSNTPVSPYSQSLTLHHPPPQSNTRRGVISRAQNSPFGGRGYAGPSSSVVVGQERVGDTPSKKKRSRVHQLGTGIDDDEGSASGRDAKKGGVKKKRPTNRAVSPTDSLASTSGIGRPEPIARTARQIAAAAAKARQAAAVESDDESDGETSKIPNTVMALSSADLAVEKNGLGLDMGGGSREGSQFGAGKAGAASGVEKARPARVRAGVKRSRADEDEDESEEEDDREDNFKSNAAKKPSVDDAMDTEAAYGDPDVDTKVYCTCRQVSFGEMIGCDDDDCEIEWFHVACLGLGRAPEGNWICPSCSDRRKRGGKRKTVKGGKRK